jgi:antitoxin (DNA-binding transcriptional repressor) of toxin-antitoxin stability system
MITKSISETRRQLAQLIEKAQRGEEIVIIKDSRPVAALRAIGPDDLELKLTVSDFQARKLWATLNEADLVSFDVPRKAVNHLKRAARTRR